MNRVNSVRENEEPTLWDTSTEGVLYEGYPDFGATEADPATAISRETFSAAGAKKEWADGDKNKDNVWNNRASLTFSLLK